MCYPTDLADLPTNSSTTRSFKDGIQHTVRQGYDLHVDIHQCRIGLFF